MEKERDSLQVQLRDINKNYEAALEKKVKMRECYEGAVYTATHRPAQE